MNYETAIVNLYLARQASKQSKKLLIEKASQVGSCDGLTSGEGPCYHFFSNSEWCEICKAKLPLWEDYHKKSHAAGVALRIILNMGKKMCNAQHEGGLNEP